jgi:peptidoglycan-associated lipoprotein
MISRKLTSALLLAALSFSSVSCGTLFKKKSKSGGIYGSDQDMISGTALGGGAAGGGAGLGTPLPERTEGSSFTSADRQRFAPVHFAFDSYVVSASEQAKVSAVATALKASRESVIVAGFTDERGTPEYNRGLGERRAAAVRQSLIGSGLSGDRIQTVSFGAEMPVDSASNEAAWAKNRRAEFGVSK